MRYASQRKKIFLAKQCEFLQVVQPLTAYTVFYGYAFNNALSLSGIRGILVRP